MRDRASKSAQQGSYAKTPPAAGTSAAGPIGLTALQEHAASSSPVRQLQAFQALADGIGRGAGGVVQRLAKIEGEEDYDNEGKLAIHFEEPREFFGGVSGLIRFDPEEGGREADKIDLVQTASMKYAEDPRRQDYEEVRDTENDDRPKPRAIPGTDDRAGQNAQTSGGWPIKDAMRTGPVGDGALAPDFHIDKVYDGADTLPGEDNSRVVQDPAYNADRRQNANGDNPLAQVRFGAAPMQRPRTNPGKNRDGEIEPTTLIDAPKSANNPVIADFETVIAADGDLWGSVNWGFETEFDMQAIGAKVVSSYSTFHPSASNAFKDALQNYQDIVRHPNGYTSDTCLAWMAENYEHKDYPGDFDKVIKAFAWALGKLTASVAKAPEDDTGERAKQTHTAKAYLTDMVRGADRALELRKPDGYNQEAYAEFESKADAAMEALG